MRALRLATVAAALLFSATQTPVANAQIFASTGEGVCRVCGHSELDTQRYVNSFLNQMFFPSTAPRRAGIAASLYLLTATYTMHGSKSPDPRYSSVTVAITAEVKNALPTGSYHVTVTTPGGHTETKTYAIGSRRFNVRDGYAPGAVRGNTNSIGIGGARNSGPPNQNGQTTGRGRGHKGPARCSRARVEIRGNETIAWCSVD